MESNAPRCDLAVIGLGVMGANLARNFADHGRRVALFDREPNAAGALAARHPEAGFIACTSTEALAVALVRPRVVVLLVPAGDPVDDALAALSGWLESGDVVVDAGNSLFRDTDRRLAATADRPWHFVGMGISGGSEGARTGPAMMPGGSRDAWERLRPLLEPVAAIADGAPCVAWCGRGSAGHFVKMVHNGIEYGDMQLIAEIASLMRRGLGWGAARCADVFDAWNEAELESYLIEITARIFRTADPEKPGALLLDAVLDRAGQKGTGRWTIEAALELGVAIPTITAAVDARIQSAALERRVEASELFSTAWSESNASGSRDDGRPDGRSTGSRGVGTLDASSPLDGIEANDLRDALYAAKIASYSQGFELLARANEVHRYGTDLASVARIWKAGCIIRARFLDEVAAAFAGSTTSPLLALTPAFAAQLRDRLPGWRRVVAAATRSGIAIPGLAASLAWFDGLVTRRGSADLIQAQRDYFGAHGYERLDAPGRAVHTDWAKARGA